MYFCQLAATLFPNLHFKNLLLVFLFLTGITQQTACINIDLNGEGDFSSYMHRLYPVYRGCVVSTDRPGWSSLTSRTGF